MSITMINGYACFDCKEVALAKKGENPRKPEDATAPDGAATKPGAVADPTAPAPRDDHRGREVDRYA